MIQRIAELVGGVVLVAAAILVIVYATGCCFR